MDQIKIGKFIASQRKNKGFTQQELADRLSISNKTVSKWETGNGFPDVSLLLSLCNELDITVNELLSAECLSEIDYRRKAEENMINLVQEAQESKKKIILSCMVCFLVLLAAVPLFIIAGAIEMKTWVRIILLVIGIFVLGFGIAIACILDRDAGAFECPECKERFIPNMKEYILGPHTLLKRRLKCPNCGSVKYCRHVLTKK